MTADAPLPTDPTPNGNIFTITGSELDPLRRLPRRPVHVRWAMADVRWLK